MAKGTITDAVYEALVARSGGHCEMYTDGPGGGRCGRSVKVEAHHLLPRGKGGGHEIENLALVCNWHHRAIEHRQIEEDDWLYEAGADGLVAFSYSSGGPPEVVLWPDVSEAREEAAAALLHEAELGAEMAEKRGPWKIAAASFELSVGGDLWKLHDMTFATYAYFLNLKPKTVKNYILAEERARSLPDDYGSCVKRASIKLMTTCGAEIAAMTAKQLREICLRIDAGDSVRALIERAREIAGVVAEEKVGNVVYAVTLSVLSATLELKVSVPEDERYFRKVAIEKALASFENRAYVVGVEWPEDAAVHQVEKISAEGESE